MTKIIPLALTALLIVVSATYSDSAENTDGKINLRALDGKWEGKGEFIVPITDLALSVEGGALFQFDEATERLRTEFTAEKFFITYSDSGYVTLDNRTDSISWEFWNNFGTHRTYFAKVTGNKIIGERVKNDNHYVLVIELVTKDSLDLKLTATEPDGKKSQRAAFNLWRVKK